MRSSGVQQHTIQIFTVEIVFTHFLNWTTVYDFCELLKLLLLLCEFLFI